MATSYNDILCDLQTNYLQNNGFQLILPRFPLVTFYSQNFSLPEMSLPPANIPTPFSDMRIAGDKIEFSPFTFQFIVDDQMRNYEEIQKWIFSIGFATSRQDYVKYKNKGEKVERLGEQDAVVSILSSKGNPTRHIKFYDAIPISLSGIEFTTQDTSTNYVMASATFAYTYFDFID
jgi:hypothetical protein